MTSARTRIPVMCDLSGAPDTPAERVDTYRRLFSEALIARERTIAGSGPHLCHRPSTIATSPRTNP